MAILKVNGKTVDINYDPAALEELTSSLVSSNYGDDSSWSVELTEEESSIVSRDRVRKTIFEKVADRDSMLGTVADASEMLVLSSVAELVSLSSAATFDEYKKARLSMIASLAGGDAAPMIKAASAMLEKVKSGEIIMPYLCKPKKASGVFDDVAKRATGVAMALQAEFSKSGK